MVEAMYPFILLNTIVFWRVHLQNPANSGGAASSLPTIRRRTGNEDVAPPRFCKCLQSVRICADLWAHQTITDSGDSTPFMQRLRGSASKLG